MPTTLTRATCLLLLLLTGLIPAGCAGVERPRVAGAAPPQAAPPTPDEVEHAALERELGLYSD